MYDTAFFVRLHWHGNLECTESVAIYGKQKCMIK